MYYSFRLRDISEETSGQQQPRRRSNSLPIPKIEVSVYQGNETKKQEQKDFIEVPEVKDVSLLAGNEPTGTVRRFQLFFRKSLPNFLCSRYYRLLLLSSSLNSPKISKLDN